MWFAQCPGNSLALTVVRYFWVFSDYATALCRPTLLREPSNLVSSTPACSVSLSVHGINVWNGKGEGLAAMTQWASERVYNHRGIEVAGLPVHYVICAAEAVVGINQCWNKRAMAL